MYHRNAEEEKESCLDSRETSQFAREDGSHFVRSVKLILTECFHSKFVHLNGEIYSLTHCTIVKFGAYTVIFVKILKRCLIPL